MKESGVDLTCSEISGKEGTLPSNVFWPWMVCPPLHLNRFQLLHFSPLEVKICKRCTVSNSAAWREMGNASDFENVRTVSDW